MFIIGTAGHVDHGKSALVTALTGVDPDRLAEEKLREMTIDLGFASLELPGIGEVGVVDVPGHRDFIENMLAGVGGIDLALLVVAADEGIMPQTTEHLAILDLLHVSSGIVAITKSDLVDDPDWLELVMLEISEAVAGTALDGAPLLPVSAHTGAGLEGLKEQLAAQLRGTPPRPDLGQPRLPVDRAFSLSGFGTVITGTLLDGSLHVGDRVVIQPAGLEGRIRGLQSHGHKRDVVNPGARAAVNVSGLSAVDVERGDVLAAPDVVRGTVLCDVSYRHLDTAPFALKHNTEVKLFVGAAERMARVRLLGVRQLDPGATGWLQLALQAPAALRRGDRFILRRPSPGATLGGGVILDPHPGRRHKRFNQRVLSQLETLAEGDPSALALQATERHGPLTLAELLDRTSLSPATGEEVVALLKQEGAIVSAGEYIVAHNNWRDLGQRLRDMVREYEQEYPLRPGLPREEARSRLQLAAPIFNHLVSEATAGGALVERSTFLHSPDFAIRLAPEQEELVGDLLAQFAEAGVNSPSVAETKAFLGEELYFALLELGYLRQLSADVVYRTEEYERLESKITDFLHTHGPASTAEIRDMLQTSRKYAIALLEHLDERKVTVRRGDQRTLNTR